MPTSFYHGTGLSTTDISDLEQIKTDSQAAKTAAETAKTASEAARDTAQSASCLLYTSPSPRDS